MMRLTRPSLNNKQDHHLDNQGRIQEIGEGATWRAREREPIWGLGALPPVGSRGKAPGQGVRGAKPP